MKLSRRARYALRMMLAIERLTRKTGGRVSLVEVSRRTGLPHRYLEQLAMSLRNAGLINGLTGKRGGYLLSRPAERILLSEIIEATIGPIRIVECLDGQTDCMNIADCECRALYRKLNERISSLLTEYSLADLENGLEG